MSSEANIYEGLYRFDVELKGGDDTRCPVKESGSKSFGNTSYDNSREEDDKMKRTFFVSSVVLVVLFSIGSIAYADSVKGHLYFYPQNSLPDHKGPWGKMHYNEQGRLFEFKFEGHHLASNTIYTLIYLPEGTLGGSGLIYFGSGITTGRGEKRGNVQIEGALDTGGLPLPIDTNYLEGAQFVLVPSSDICIRGATPYVITWDNVDQWLFGEWLIPFVDTDAFTECAL